jgi:hypothetical protein
MMAEAVFDIASAIVSYPIGVLRPGTGLHADR